MKIKRIFLATLSAIFVCSLSAFFCACDFDGPTGSDNHVHSFINYVSDNNATCTQNGTQTAKCESCDETDTCEIINSKLKHSFTNYISDGNATCTEDGTETAKCDNCTETDTRVAANGKLGHSWGEWEEVTPASCLEDGAEKHTCTVCKESEQRKITAAGHHEWGEWEEVTPASCLEDGTEKHTCTVCKESEQRKITAAGHHEWGEWQTVTEAICGKEGVEERTCSVCHEKEHNIIPAPGEHNWGDWQTVTEATCGKDGKKEHTCSICDETESEAIPATGLHNWSEWTEVAPAKCLEDGAEERTCSVCEESEQRKIPAIGSHDWSEWTEKTPVSCLEDGEEERTCSACNESERRVLHAVGSHSWGEWRTVTAATCVTGGTKERICTACNETENGTIPALGHSFTNYVENPDGSKTAKCDRCEETDTIQNDKTEFSIHFLELGNGNAGDCVLIDCGDTELLIDAGSKRNSTETVKKYINQYCTDGVLEYVITTHAHEDHIAALVGETNKNNGVMYSYKIGTIITYARHNTTSQVSKDFETAITYAESQGAVRYTASQCYNETDGAKRQYYLDEAQTLSFNILYNYYYEHSSSDENEYSVVTLLTQELAGGNKHYLFTGDLEENGESRMVDYYKNSANSKSEFDILPKVVIYKAGHHGSKTSSSAKLMQVIQPEYVAVCCCCGQPEYTTTNDNTFPTQQMLDNVGKYTDKIYVTSLAANLPAKDANGNYVNKASKDYTSMNGDIRFFIKGDELELKCTNNNTILKETDWFKENRTWNGI